VNARAPFGEVADVLGVSDHTVARRYRRLRGAGVLRVVGVPHGERLGRTEWFLRLRCLPDSAPAIATALGRRDDISWVMLTSAGTEITCLAQAKSRDQRDALLLTTLPRTRQVVEVDALCVLRTFFGGATGWNGRTGSLTPEQVARLAPDRPEPTPVTPTGQDETVLAALRRDGRLPITDLAAELGCSQSAASRRLDQLVASGAAAHPHVALAAATSGPTNLLLMVGCRDIPDLYEYIAHQLGPLPAVQSIRTSPVIRTVKRAGTVLELS
jgi:DNA-binding Lrp family transcriptional regulator